MKEEMWRPIEGFPNYEVSNFGRVRNCMFGHIRKLVLVESKGHAYLTVALFENGTPSNKQVARLVAGAFIEVIPDKHRVIHADGNTQNNNVENLRIVPDIVVLAAAHKHPSSGQGMANHNVKLTDGDIREIRTLKQEGMTEAQIAGRYGVTTSTINLIVKRKNWTHIE